MSEKSHEEAPRWYVVYTYSGYENKVKANLEKIIENRRLEDKILEIIIPMEEEIEIKDGKQKVALKKVFPGYILVKMFMDDITWYAIKSIKGVFNFVGSGDKPVPLTDEEMQTMGIEEGNVSVDYQIGDTVRVVFGPLENFIGSVKNINQEKQKVEVLLSMFGRETIVDFDFTQIQKI